MRSFMDLLEAEHDSVMYVMFEREARGFKLVSNFMHYVVRST